MPGPFNDQVRDFLLRVLGNADPHSRGALLRDFPSGLAGEVIRHPAPLDDIQAMADQARRWGRLDDGRQAVEVLLESVRRRVQGGELEGDLDRLVGGFREELRGLLRAHLGIVTDPSRAAAARRDAAIWVSDHIDPRVGPDVFADLDRAFSSSAGDPAVRYWLAIALRSTRRPEAAQALRGAGAEEHPLATQGIDDALEALRVTQVGKDLR
jgi:hypothetical protein